MSSSAAISKAPLSNPLGQVKKPKPITWAAFQKKYLTREDGYKYEWVNGQVEKTKRAMDKSQLFILRNLMDFFNQLKIAGKVKGHIIAEPDLFFLKNHRRPDICWLTDEQINSLAIPGAYEVPAFLIEVVSSNDQINKVRHKLINYRDAGVKVVWMIYPSHKQVEVFTGENLEHSTTFEGEQTCSAAPALPAFEISVDEVFYLPTT